MAKKMSKKMKKEVQLFLDGGDLVQFDLTRNSVMAFKCRKSAIVSVQVERGAVDFIDEPELSQEV